MTVRPAATGYSYIRFSTAEQAAGDSLRRQTADALAWCQRHNVRLDETTTLRDLGKSAFTGAHRKNPDRHALAAFLKLVERGQVPRGSFLIIESLDRLPREHVRAGLMLLLGLIEAGVRIVQLSPSELVYDEKADEMQLMLAIVELSRGHCESKRKSDLNGKAWQAKLARARESGEVITTRLPAWVEAGPDGRLRLIPDRAAVVRRMFALAAAGYGITAVAQKLEAEGVPPFGGPSGAWHRSYVGKVLKDRRALGEHQPYGGGHKPDGPPIANYFPPAVTEEEFKAARAGADSRRQKPDRLAAVVNVFAGLLTDARSGESYYAATYGSRGRGRVLVNKAGAEGRAPYRSFPAEVFERAVLSCLREIDPQEVLNGDRPPDETQALAGELADVEASIASLVADLDAHGDSPALYQRLRQKEARKAELVPLLAAARERAAHPLSESWGECQSLIDALDNADDPQDARLRLRSALRRIVEGISLLVVPRGHTRLAAVQVWFTGGRHRDYLIMCRQGQVGWGRPHRPPQWSVLSSADVEALGPLDLRQPEHARRLERALLAANVAGLAGD